MKTIVWILSEGRSGSTWLAYVLGSHSRCAFLGEYYLPWASPKRHPCNLCSARGRETCEVLTGIESVPEERALDFAFERFGEKILIETSKKLKWTTGFIDRKEYDHRCIHLIRDPRGWYESQRRRYEFTVEEGMARWVGNNRFIADFGKQHNASIYTCWYDQLAQEPDKYFPPLLEFVGFSYEPAALEYWKFDHHGPAGNGAAYNLLGEFDGAPLLTGDDSFYEQNSRKQFYDTRWKERLSEAEVKYIENNAEVRGVLGELGYGLL